MIAGALERAARQAGGRVIAALAARFRDLDLAEEAYAEACLKAASRWSAAEEPRDPAAWLYRAAERCALDALRRRRTRTTLAPDPPEPEPTPEDAMLDEAALIPDERLRLIFVCCHPAVAPDARAALTLRLVCGLPTRALATAFLVPEPTLAQRLVRAKRKIAEAGVPFAVPGPEAWRERLDAVLSTLEIAYAHAHADAAGTGEHAGYAAEMLSLSRILTQLLPGEPGPFALAAVIRFAEARRPARLAPGGAMVPLSDQDPARWTRALIDEGDADLRGAIALGPMLPRTLQAAIHGTWCSRTSLAEPAPWPDILRLYDRLLTLRDDPIVRLNRAVALAEVAGPAAALAVVGALGGPPMDGYLPFQVVLADLLARTGAVAAARAAYDTALALGPASAERLFLQERRDSLGTSGHPPNGYQQV